MSRALTTNTETVTALQELYASNNGRLHPENVVEVAKAENSPLHKYFEWEDSEAAEKYRMWQARTLISMVSVQMKTPEGKGVKTPLFVSLSSDRKSGGGYRLITEVMSDTSMRNTMLQDALDDMKSFEDKYKNIKDLATVIEHMREERAKLEKFT